MSPRFIREEEYYLWVYLKVGHVIQGSRATGHFRLFFANDGKGVVGLLGIETTTHRGVGRSADIKGFQVVFCE